MERAAGVPPKKRPSSLPATTNAFFCHDHIVVVDRLLVEDGKASVFQNVTLFGA